MPMPTCINVFVVDTVLVQSTATEMKLERRNTETWDEDLWKLLPTEHVQETVLMRTLWLMAYFT